MDKIQRATEIHRSMTPHQMALRIAELENGVAEIVEQAVTEHNKRITELQDALELAEEAVRAKQSPDAGKMVPEGWQLVPAEPTDAMIDASDNTAACVYDHGCGSYLDNPEDVYRAMLAAAPKLGGE